jgi:hypothetical protein
MILQNMKDLLLCLPGLQRLELVDLQLVGSDGRSLLITRAFKHYFLSYNASRL